MMETILACTDVSKSIRKKQILESVTFTLSRGEILGILGADGAGKTMLFRILSGLSFPDSGTVEIEDYSLKKDYAAAMAHVRCVLRSDYFYKNLTGRENLKLFLHGSRNAESRIDDMIVATGLETLIDEPVSRYTDDTLRLLALAHALSYEPKLLILDDFFVSMNSWQVKNFGDLLKRLVHEHEMTVLVSLQSYSTAELMCDRVCFLCDGKAMYIKSIDDMQRESGKIPYRFELRDIIKAKRLLTDAYSLVIVGEGRNYLDLSITHDEIPVYNKLFVDNDIEVFGIERREVSISQTITDMRGGDML